jgi:hypothetical protein
VTAAQRRALVVTVSWRALVAALSVVAAWDAAGLVLGGDAGYRAACYATARAVPGGIRAWGVALAVCTVAVIAGLNLYVNADRAACVRWGLAGLTAWWAAWTVGLLASWVVARDSSPHPGALVAGAAVLAAVLLASGRLSGPAAALPAAAGVWLLAWGAGLHTEAWAGPAQPAGLAAAAWLAARALPAARTAEAITPGGR